MKGRMHNYGRRLIAAVLAVVLGLSLVPFSGAAVYAAQDDGKMKAYEVMEDGTQREVDPSTIPSEEEGEKEISIKELNAEASRLSEDLEQRKTALSQDIENAKEANDRQAASLHNDMLKKKARSFDQ